MNNSIEAERETLTLSLYFVYKSALETPFAFQDA